MSDVTSMNRLRFFLLSLGSLCWAFPGTAQTAPSKWVSYDAASKTVTFALEAGVPGTAGPVNFNGYTNGGTTLVVPPASTVDMNFPAAYTKDVAQGLPQGGKDVMRFTAPPSGSFRIFCGVPGHGLSGMWIRFKVDPAATAGLLSRVPKRIV